MSHPFQFIPSETLLQTFLVLLILFLIVSTGLWFASTSLKPGILTFEFDALGTIKKWDETEKERNNSARIRAAFNTGLDFLFLIVYSNTFALACVWAATKFQSPWSTVGIWLAWGQWLAACFDIIEDIALVYILFGSRSSSLAKLAKVSAGIKFAIITIGLLYVCVAGISYLRGATGN